MTNQNPDAVRLQKALEGCPTVAEVIEMLQGHNPDTKCVFHYGSGDHWHTQIADGACNIEEVDVEWSGYHRTLKISDDHYNDSYDDDEGLDDELPETASVIAIGSSSTY